MFKSMPIHKRDSLRIMKSNFIISYLAFKSSMLTTIPPRVNIYLEVDL